MWVFAGLGRPPPPPPFRRAQCASGSSTRAVGGQGLFLKLCTGRLCVAQFCHLPLAKHFLASSPLAPWPSVCLLHPSCGAPYVSQREGGGGIEPAVPGDPSERAVVQEVFFQARGPVNRRSKMFSPFWRTTPDIIIQTHLQFYIWVIAHPRPFKVDEGPVAGKRFHFDADSHPSTLKGRGRAITPRT